MRSRRAARAREMRPGRRASRHPGHIRRGAPPRARRTVRKGTPRGFVQSIRASGGQSSSACASRATRLRRRSGIAAHSRIEGSEQEIGRQLRRYHSELCGGARWPSPFERRGVSCTVSCFRLRCACSARRVQACAISSRISLREASTALAISRQCRARARYSLASSGIGRGSSPESFRRLIKRRNGIVVPTPAPTIRKRPPP